MTAGCTRSVYETDKFLDYMLQFYRLGFEFLGESGAFFEGGRVLLGDLFYLVDSFDMASHPDTGSQQEA